MSQPRKHQDPERAEARRCQVLDAAAVCFTERGFHGASMADISKRAGMSAGHIYNYFTSKEEIIFGIVDRNVEDVLLRMRDLVLSDSDVLDALFARAGEAIERNTDLAHVKLMTEVATEAGRNPVVAQKLRAADAFLGERLHALLMSSAKADAYRNDPQRQGRLDMLIALFEGVRLRILHNPGLDKAALVEPLRRAMRAVLVD